MNIVYYVENPELIINAEHLELNKLEDFPFDVIKSLPDEKAKRGEKKHDKNYVSCYTSTDSETTKIPNEELSVMWLFQVGLLIEDTIYFVGIRKVATVKQFLEKLAAELGYSGKGKPRCMIIFDFNWNYEFGFLRSWFPIYDIFFKDIEHPLYGTSHGGHFEWRDAQALFGPGGLAAATKGLEYEKLKGDLDYSKKRFYWTKIDAAPAGHSEFDYCVYDVAGLCQAVKREVERNGVSLFGLKRTFTGWSRKDMSRILYKMRIYKDSITEHDTFECFQALEEAKRGGNTHANKEYVGDPYDFNCKDVSSMYPDSMIHDKFPYGPFYPIRMPDKATYEGYIERGEYAVLARIQVYNLELKDELEPVPYISKDKCRAIVGLGQLNKFTRNGTTVYKQSTVTGEEDNGRISYCCFCEMTITDEDFRVMRDMYNFDYDVINMWVSKYEYLPKEIRDYLINLYKVKTEYKDRGAEFESDYAKAKVRLNSVYGLFCANLLTDSVVYDSTTDDYYTQIEYKKPTFEIEQDYYERIKKVLLVPRIGIWVCAHCRRKLQRLIDTVGVDFLYCDTDSVFYLNAAQHEDAINALNEEYKDRAIESGCYATDVKGHVHYCGFFEDDKDGKIVTLGSKKYAYEKDGKIKLTVAGVPKKEGSKELEEAGGLEAFKPGMVFHAGKLRPIYNKENSYGTRHVYDCDGVEGDVEVTSNVCLVDVDYKLGYGETYGNLIDAVKRGDFSLLHEMLENTDRDALTAEVLKRRYHLEN